MEAPSVSMDTLSSDFQTALIVYAGTEAPSVSIETLPCDISLLILVALEDSGDVLHAISAVPALLHAFNDQHAWLVHQELDKTVPSELQAELVALYSLKKMPAGTPAPEGVALFHDLARAEAQLAAGDFTWQMLREACAFHALAKSGASDYFWNAGIIFTIDDLRPERLLSTDRHTATETARVVRAYYRIEAFYHVFSAKFSRPAPPERWIPGDVFLRHYMPWELEQMVSVLEFLAQSISSVFNDVVSHDVYLGARGFRADKRDDSQDMTAGKTGVISGGLAYVTEVTAVPTWQERRALVATRVDADEAHLWQSINRLYGGQELEAPLQPLDVERVGPDRVPGIPCPWPATPRVADPTAGGPALWRWSHQRNHVCDFAATLEHHWLRMRGYVFWDQPRVADRIDTDQPWEDPLAVEYVWIDPATRDGTAESLHRRRIIYLAGGRGYWAPDDESRVVFEDIDKAERERRDQEVAGIWVEDVVVGSAPWDT